MPYVIPAPPGFISKHFRLVPFTAACPACGTDAEWGSFVVVGGDDNPGTHTKNHVDCPRCGPCPCPYHETVQGVAA